MDACWGWAAAEPYSTRPYLVASYWACVTTDEPAVGKQFAKAGLQANPLDPGLLNNLACAFGRLGALTEGERWYTKARQALRQDGDRIGLWALDGLWAYRRRDLNRGRECYSEAMALAVDSLGADETYRLALHWMEEEVDMATVGARVAALAVVDAGADNKEEEISALRIRVKDKSKRLEEGALDPRVRSALRSARIIN